MSLGFNTVTDIIIMLLLYQTIAELNSNLFFLLYLAHHTNLCVSFESIF